LSSLPSVSFRFDFLNVARRDPGEQRHISDDVGVAILALQIAQHWDNYQLPFEHRPGSGFGN
jgi:hypothetical protein